MDMTLAEENDLIRRTISLWEDSEYNRLEITDDVWAEGEIVEVLRGFREFGAFRENDSHHSNGVFEASGKEYEFTIRYLDPELTRFVLPTRDEPFFRLIVISLSSDQPFEEYQ